MFLDSDVDSCQTVFLWKSVGPCCCSPVKGVCDRISSASPAGIWLDNDWWTTNVKQEGRHPRLPSARPRRPANQAQLVKQLLLLDFLNSLKVHLWTVHPSESGCSFSLASKLDPFQALCASLTVFSHLKCSKVIILWNLVNFIDVFTLEFSCYMICLISFGFQCRM